MIVRLGDTGDLVRRVQALVGVTPDGVFGPATRDAVAAWQEARHLLGDGVAGPLTLEAMGLGGVPSVRPPPIAAHEPQAHLERAVAGGLRLRMRADAHAALRPYPYPIWSAGGLRALGAAVTANRSRTSLHYLGRALDLALGQGLTHEAATGRYLCEDAGGGLWQVWQVAAPDGTAPDLAVWPGAQRRMVNAVDARGRVASIIANVVDVTAAMKACGFERIQARPGWAAKRDSTAAEWWHFQFTGGLVVGETTFGSELVRTWRAGVLRASPVWRYAGLRWTGRGFA